MVAGKIAGLESYKTDKQNFKQVIGANDVVVGDKLLDAFRSFAAADKKNGLNAANINGQAEYAKQRIRQELATADFSNEAGVQVFLETDPQILKAIESMPQAGKIAELAFSKTFARQTGLGN